MTNYLELDGTRYELSQGFIHFPYGVEVYSQDGKNELLYMTAVELYSKNAEIYHTANQLSGIEGIGEMLLLTFYFNKQELKPGKYTIENIYAFDEVLKDGLVTKSYNLGVGIGLDFRDNGTGDFYNLREGDISIRKSGNEYTVEVDVLTTNSKRVKAKYTGALPVFGN